MPDKGFEMKLGDGQLLRLMEDRRQRDIVRPHHPEQAAPDQHDEGQHDKDQPDKESADDAPPSSPTSKRRKNPESLPSSIASCRWPSTT